MRTRSRSIALLSTAVLVAAVAAPMAAPVAAQEEYPREETLYTSGTQYGAPSSWNPIWDGQYAMGTLGLLYEPLFTYDPLTADQANAYTPWLAESGEWTTDTEYTLKLREGLTWQDGEPLTSADVVFTLELGKLPNVPYSSIWSFLSSVEAVDDLTVKFTFSEANYQQWSNFLYNRAIVPEHIWKGTLDTEETITGANGPDPAPDRQRALQVLDRRPGPHGLGAEPRLVGHRGPGSRSQAPVHRGHRQRRQQRDAGPGAPGPDRPVQQLPAGHGQPARRWLRAPGLLPGEAVPHVRQHGVAGAQHHQGTAR